MAGAEANEAALPTETAPAEEEGTANEKVASLSLHNLWANIYAACENGANKM